MSIRATILIAAAALAATISHATAGEGEPITEAEKPVMVATRIFALENHLYGDIGVADEDEGHIGERFEVNHAPGQKCTFTMRHRDGQVIDQLRSSVQRVQSLAARRLRTDRDRRPARCLVRDQRPFEEVLSRPRHAVEGQHVVADRA
jgi:hypothetical protein